MSKHIGKAVQVYWKDDDAWYDGCVDEYHPDQGWHVQYFDGDDEWLLDIDDETLVRFDKNEKDFTQDLDLGDTGMTMQRESKELELVIAETKEEVESTIGSKEKADDKLDVDKIFEGEDTGELDDTMFCIVEKKNEEVNEEGDEELLEEASVEEQERMPHMNYNNDIPKDKFSDKVLNSEMYDDGNELNEANEENEVNENEVDGRLAFDLPDRGILLIGNITSATNMPPHAENETDGRAFFRVLYVEGGTQSTMFRCKTPIYSSDQAKDLNFPEWDKGSFRFEMVLPDPSNKGIMDQLSTAPSIKKVREKIEPILPKPKPFRVHGEILVALYRTRAQGGSEFVGQASFDLADLAKSGTTHHSYHVGTHVRSTNGSFPVINRMGDVAGGGLCHVDVQLELAWKADGVDTSEENSVHGEEGARLRPPVVHVRGGVQTTGPPKVPNALRPGEPKKQKTLNAKRQILRSHQINKENIQLAKRIKAHNIKGTNKHTSVKKAEDVYMKPPPDAGSQPKNAAEATTLVFSKKVQKMSYQELRVMYNELKKEVFDRERTKKQQIANLSKLRLHTKKYGLANDRMRKKIDSATQPLISQDTDSKEAAARSPSQADTKEMSSAEEKDSMRDLADTPNEQFINSVTDPEFREHLIEFAALQEARRALVKRTESAKKQCAIHQASLEDSQQREMVARQRLGSAFSKLGNKYAGRASDKNRKPLTEKEKAMENDLQSIERVRGVQLELARSEAAYAAGVHLGTLNDTMSELSGVENKLTSIIKEMGENLVEARHKKAVAKEKLDTLRQERVSVTLRDNIGMMNQVLLDLCRHQKIRLADSSADAIELESLKMTLKRQQNNEIY